MILKQDNRKTYSRYFIRVLYFFVLLFVGPLVSQAQTLPSGLVIGDDSGIYANSEGEYYIDLPAVLPGEHYDKTITIRSLDLKEPFELGLLVEPVSSKGDIDFNQVIQLTLILDGKELYKGPLLGDGSFDWRIEPLILGTSQYGTDQILEVRFDVDKNLSNKDFSKDSQLLYQWTFVATQDVPPTSTSQTEESSTKDKPVVKPNPTGRLPQTGEERRNIMYQILLGLFILVVVILLWKKRKENEEVDRREQDE